MSDDELMRYYAMLLDKGEVPLKWQVELLRRFMLARQSH